MKHSFILCTSRAGDEGWVRGHLVKGNNNRRGTFHCLRSFFVQSDRRYLKDIGHISISNEVKHRSNELLLTLT